MIVYCAISSDSEARRHFSSKREAIKAARDFGPGSYVAKYDIGKIDRAKVLKILDWYQFAEKVETIWAHPEAGGLHRFDV